MARSSSNPDEIKRTVEQFASDAIGTHVRNVTGAAEIGGKIKDTAQRGWRAAKRWWEGPPRRTTDIRLPNEGRRSRGRTSGRR